MAVILGAIIIRKCNINTIRSIFLWIRVRLVKSVSKRINLKSLKKFYTRTILSGAAGLLEVYMMIVGMFNYHKPFGNGFCIKPEF